MSDGKCSTLGHTVGRTCFRDAIIMQSKRLVCMLQASGPESVVLRYGDKGQKDAR